jgi:hypothetical protein
VDLTERYGYQSYYKYYDYYEYGGGERSKKSCWGRTLRDSVVKSIELNHSKWECNVVYI